MTWFLVFILWSGGGMPQILKYPTTSASACNDARQGVKFGPATSASMMATGAVVTGAAGYMAVFCLAGAEPQFTIMQPPPPPPGPEPQPDLPPDEGG